MYKTLTGLHLLGAAERPNDLLAQFADGWSPPVKVVDSVGYALEIDSLFDLSQARVMRWWAYNGFMSDSFSGWVGNDTPENAALRWVNHMKQELDRLAQAVGTWWIEVFNEQGVGITMCRFYVELARLLKQRYGNKLKVAALSMSSGSYNDFSNWTMIYDWLLKPIHESGLEVALSLHAYSSLIYPVGNEAGLQHIEMTPQTDVHLDTLPDFRLSGWGKEPRQRWTGLAPADIIQILYTFGGDYFKTPILITESHIDNMGNVFGIGAGGPHEWARKGAYDQIKAVMYQRLGKPVPDYETFCGDSLWYGEQFWQKVNAAGGNILGVFPFTWTDSNQQSRWHIDFRHKGGIFNQFKYRAKSAGPTPPPVPDPKPLPDFSTVDYCALATLSTTPVNVRIGPGTTFEGISQLSPYEVYRITHYFVNEKGETWYRVAYQQNTFGWCAGTWLNSLNQLVPITRRNDDLCTDIPEWQEPTSPPEEPSNEVSLGKLLVDLYRSVLKWLKRIISGT